MANTYSSLHYHIVFSTKHRERWITPDIEQRIWAYLGGIARENKMKPLQIGGIDDHVHVLLGAPPTIAPSRYAKTMLSSAIVFSSSSRPSRYRWIPKPTNAAMMANRIVFFGR